MLTFSSRSVLIQMPQRTKEKEFLSQPQTSSPCPFILNATVGSRMWSLMTQTHCECKSQSTLASGSRVPYITATQLYFIGKGSSSTTPASTASPGEQTAEHLRASFFWKMSTAFPTEIQRRAWGPAAWTPRKALLETKNLSDVAAYTCNLSTYT